MKRTTSAKKNSRSNGSSKKHKPATARFAVCISNRDYSASLEPRKIYRVLPDSEAAGRGLVRVIDESGEDYLYPGDYFLPISLPDSVQRALASMIQ